MPDQFTRIAHILHFGRKSISSRSGNFSKLDKLAMNALFDMIQEAMSDRSFTLYERQVRRAENKLDAQRKQDLKQHERQMNEEWMQQFDQHKDQGARKQVCSPNAPKQRANAECLVSERQMPFEWGDK